VTTLDTPAPTESVELREVRGPSALGGGLRRAWDLLYLMAATEFKRTYFGTTLGYLWSVGRPLALFGVLLVVFTKALHIQGGIVHYPQLLLLNLVLFGLFQEGTITALPSIVANEGIVRKTQFPRLVIPVASVLTATFNIGLNLIVTLAFVLGAGVSPRWTWLLLPVVVVLILVLTIAVAMLLSSLYPRFRDMAIIWTVASTALFYGTPVLYALDAIHSQTVRDAIGLNPLTPILALARKWVIDPHAPGPVAICGGAGRLAIAAGIYAVICVLAVIVFQREAPRIAEAL
jgi:ABC-2 type transport system permease protein